MSNELLNWITKMAPNMYPGLFSSQSDKTRLGNVAQQAYEVVNKFAGGNQVSSSIFKQLLLLYTAHLMNGIENHNYSAIKAADLSVNFSNNNNGANGNDPYMNEFLELLKALGLIDDWKIDIY